MVWSVNKLFSSFVPRYLGNGRYSPKLLLITNRTVRAFSIDTKIDDGDLG